MTDRELTHLYGSIGTLLAVIAILLALFLSSEVRSWVQMKYYERRYRKVEEFNLKLDARIALIQELSESPAKAQAFFFAQAFMLSIFFSVVFFFSVMLLLKAQPLVTFFAFFGFWTFLLIAAAYPFDVAVRLRRPERSIAWLNERKKPRP